MSSCALNEAVAIFPKRAHGLLVIFASRQDAGCKLGRRLRETGVKADLVIGLPRGGVVVAAEVARLLQQPLDILVVRKIGHPQHREFAVGALAENDVTLLDETVIAGSLLLRAELNGVIAEERARLREYQKKFRRGRKPDFSGKNILVVDDGLATGATAEAAVLSIRKSGARNIILAVPVASTSAMERLQAVADGVIALIADPEFNAVGRYYRRFDATSDEEVLALLRGPNESPAPPS